MIDDLPIPAPCPECGSDDVLCVLRFPSATKRNTIATFHAECNDCHLCGPQPPEPQTARGALVAWNDEFVRRVADRDAHHRRALLMGLQIWDEYMSQIAHCVSQDYARLNEFPMLCAKLGVELPSPRES